MKYSLVLAAILATTAYATPPDPLKVENAETLTATVAAIDQSKRLVTLKADNGNTQTIEVGPDVKNLAQVKAGDKVIVRYYEGLAAQLKKKGEAPPASQVESRSVAAAAPAGMKPAGLVGATVNSTVVIEAVDKTAQTVTFNNKDGTQHTVAVKKPEAQKFIAGLKKGDEVDITYTQALAISVEPAMN
jgi:plastocyanin